MNVFTDVLVLAALLGSALVAGTFFAFSSFVMSALARRPAAEGIAAMQSINVVVINRSFLGAFIGTALLSLAIAVLAATATGEGAALLLLAGAASYLLGTFLVTVRGNVPLNDALAAVDARDEVARETWAHYLDRWTALNTVRTVAAACATLFFAAALIQ